MPKLTLQTALLLQTYQVHVELIELNRIAIQVTKDSQGPLIAFRDRVVSRYGESLGVEATSTSISIARQKITWHVVEKGKVVELEDMLQKNHTLLTEIIVIATA
jgi:hypothetical protein